MAWFLALQGPPNKAGQSPTYELHESADIEQITQEMGDSAAADRAVAIPVVFHNRRQQVTLYVRPAAWGAWAFYQMTEDERREMMAANPVINALAQAQAAKQQQARAPQQPAGPSTLPRLS
jgi:hypothetical protein